MEKFNKHGRRSATLGLALLMLMGCNSKKQRLGALPSATTDSTTATATLPPAAPVDVPTNNVQARTVMLRGQGRYESPATNISINYRIHIERGQRIWLTAGVGPLEGVRLLATPQQFSAIYRLDRKYIQGDYTSLQNRLGISVDYQLLEDLLLGNATTQSPLYQPYPVPVSEGQAQPTYRLRDARYILNYFLNPEAKLERLQAVDASGQAMTEAIYSGFDRVPSPQGDAALIAKQVDVAVPLKGTRVQLQHRDVVLGAEGLTFAFSIPPGYEPIQ